MRDNPALAKVPLAVGGRPEQRGVIATCNYIARQFGVKSAISTAKALRLCPELQVLSGNMEKYRQVSQQIMLIFQDYTNKIEPLSLDEAYLDVSGSDFCHGSATLIAQEIKQRVKQEIGITLSAGVAPNKFLAKIASDWDKPDGLFVITPEQIEQFVATLPVNKISGVGKKTAEKLNKLGLHRCQDVRGMSLMQLTEHFGKFGNRLFELAQGIDNRPVNPKRERKSVSVEYTYPQDIPDLNSCLQQLPSILQELEGRYLKLQTGNLIAGAVIKVKFNDFVQTTAELSSNAPNESDFKQLLIEAYARRSLPVRLLGAGYKLQTKTSVESCQLEFVF